MSRFDQLIAPPEGMRIFRSSIEGDGEFVRVTYEPQERFSVRAGEPDSFVDDELPEPEEEEAPVSRLWECVAELVKPGTRLELAPGSSLFVANVEGRGVRVTGTRDEDSAGIVHVDIDQKAMGRLAVDSCGEMFGEWNAIAEGARDVEIFVASFNGRPITMTSLSVWAR